jgi:hypothetical protein
VLINNGFQFSNEELGAVRRKALEVPELSLEARIEGGDSLLQRGIGNIEIGERFRTGS